MFPRFAARCYSSTSNACVADITLGIPVASTGPSAAALVAHRASPDNDPRRPPRRASAPDLAGAERIPIVAGDALVALADRSQLLVADDFIDRAERPVAGAAENLAQDRVGRRGAVGPH